MLERRRSPASRTYEGDVPVLAGSSSVGRLGPERSTERACLLLGPSNLHPKTPTPASTPSSLHAESLALTSIVHRAARVFRRHPAFGYIAAFAFVGIATALQWLGRDLFQGAPFVAAYPAIALAGLLGGYRPGLLAAALAGMAQWYLFIPEFHLLAIVTYGFDVLLGISLIAYINRTLEKETQAKEHQALLKDELGHRMHNLFAVIQSVIRFSLPNNNIPVFPRVIEDRLVGRMQAMSDANRYVGDSTGNVALLDLVRGQMRGLGNRIIIHGRPHLLLDPLMTQNFSLILHELVTNSLKYGALSTSDGRVHIGLKETRSGVAFDWTEANGPKVKAPADDGGGFGSHILGPFARGFCTDVKISYEPSGLRYGLRIPRDQRV
jgi:two-component sensor histidine kinase